MLNAAKNNSLSPAGPLVPLALRVFLLLVVTLCLGQTRVWGFGVTPQPASGVFESVTPSSIGENYDGCPYDASDSLLAAKTPLTSSIGDLRAAGLKDAHHVIQDAAVRDLPGYSTRAAPGVALPGPSTAVGSPHYIATQVQRQAGGGTYAAERRIGYKGLRQSGYTKPDARQIISETDAWFQSIGVTPTTPTRIPGNR